MPGVAGARTRTISGRGFDGDKLDPFIVKPFQAKCGCAPKVGTDTNADRPNKAKIRDGKGADEIHLTDSFSRIGVDERLFRKIDPAKLFIPVALGPGGVGPADSESGPCRTVPCRCRWLRVRVADRDGASVTAGDKGASLMLNPNDFGAVPDRFALATRPEGLVPADAGSPARSGPRTDPGRADRYVCDRPPGPMRDGVVQTTEPAQVMADAGRVAAQFRGRMAAIDRALRAG